MVRELVRWYVRIRLFNPDDQLDSVMNLTGIIQSIECCLLFFCKVNLNSVIGFVVIVFIVLTFVIFPLRGKGCDNVFPVWIMNIIMFVKP